MLSPRYFCKIVVRHNEAPLSFALDVETEALAIAGASVIDRRYPGCVGYEVFEGERLIYSMWRTAQVRGAAVTQPSRSRFYCKVAMEGEPITIIELEADDAVEADKAAMLIRRFHAGFETFELWDHEEIIFRAPSDLSPKRSLPRSPQRIPSQAPAFLLEVADADRRLADAGACIAGQEHRVARADWTGAYVNRWGGVRLLATMRDSLALMEQYRSNLQRNAEYYMPSRRTRQIAAAMALWEASEASTANEGHPQATAPR